MYVPAIIAALSLSFSGSSPPTQSTQVAGEAWSSCLTEKVTAGLTKGDLFRMTDGDLTKRVNAGFAACMTQEAAYAANAPNPVAQRKAIYEGRGQFRDFVFDLWLKVREEARDQGAK